MTFAGFALAVAALFTQGHIGAGEREDRGNRWVIAAFGFLGLLLGCVPAYTERMGILTVDGDAVRWIGVVLNALGGALRIYPVFVLGRRFSGLVAIQPGHTLVTDDIYGVLRHPSYLGLILNALGWVLVFRSGVGEVHPDEQFTARYPQELGARITFRIKDQRVFVKEQHGYEGGLANPGADGGQVSMVERSLCG